MLSGLSFGKKTIIIMIININNNLTIITTTLFKTDETDQQIIDLLV